MFKDEKESPLSHIDDSIYRDHIVAACNECDIFDPVSWIRNIDSRLASEGVSYWNRQDIILRWHEWMLRFNKPYTKGAGVKKRIQDVCVAMIDMGAPLMIERLNRFPTRREFFYGNIGTLDYGSEAYPRYIRGLHEKNHVIEMAMRMPGLLSYQPTFFTNKSIIDWMDELMARDFYTFVLDVDLRLRRSYSAPFIRKGKVDYKNILMQCGDVDIVKLSVVFTNIATDDLLIKGSTRIYLGGYSHGLVMRDMESYERREFDFCTTHIGGLVIGKSPDFKFVASSESMMNKGLEVSTDGLIDNDDDEVAIGRAIADRVNKNILRDIHPDNIAHMYSSIRPTRISAIKNSESSISDVPPSEKLISGWHFCQNSKLFPMYSNARSDMRYTNSFDSFCVNGGRMATMPQRDTDLSGIVMMSAEDQINLSIDEQTDLSVGQYTGSRPFYKRSE